MNIITFLLLIAEIPNWITNVKSQNYRYGVASDFQYSQQIINNFAALWTTAAKCPTGVVGVVTPIGLANPITSFVILCVSA